MAEPDVRDLVGRTSAVLSVLVAGLFLLGDLTPLRVPVVLLVALVVLGVGAAGVLAAVRRLLAPPPTPTPAPLPYGPPYTPAGW